MLASGEMLRFQTTEPGIHLEAAWNGGLMQPVDGDLTAPAQGNHVLAVLARDAVGNASPVRWFWVRVDAKPPEVALVLEPPAASSAQGRTMFVQPGTRLKLSANDTLSGLARLHVATNGEEHVLDTGQTTLTLPQEGLVNLQVWAEDDVGNRSRPIEMALHVDGQAPSGAAQIIGDFIYPDYPDRKWRVAAPLIDAEVTVVDEDSGPRGWQWRINGNLIDPEAQPKNWPGGDYQVAIIAKDRAGNEAVLTELDFTVDDTPPTLDWTLNGPMLAQASSNDSPCATGPVTATLTSHDDFAGVFSLFQRGANGLWQPIHANQVTGTNLDIMAVDWVGNSIRKSSEWLIDTQSPTITLTTAAHKITDAGFELRLQVGEPVNAEIADIGCGLARATYRLDDGPWQSVPPHFQFDKPSRHRLHIRAEDRAGHTADLAGTVVVMAPGGEQ